MWIIISFLSILLLAIVVAWFKDVHIKEGKQVKLFALRLCIDYGIMAHACHIPSTQCFCGTICDTEHSYLLMIVLLVVHII